MNWYWAFSTCVATLLLAVYAEEPNVEIPTECPKVDSPESVVLLAHEYDCTKFYMCLRGEKILKVCGPMDHSGNLLHFNPEKQVCDWPSESGCKNNGTSMDESTTEDVTDPSTENSTEQSTTEDVTDPSTEFPATETSTEQSTTEDVTDPSTELPNTENSTEQPTTEDVTNPSTELPVTEISTEQSTTEDVTDPSTELPTTENSTEQPTTEDVTNPSTELPTTETSTEQSTTEGTADPSTELPTTTENSAQESTTEGVTITDGYVTETSTDELVTDTSSTEDVSGTTEGTTDEPSTVHPEDSKLCSSDGSMNGVFYPHKSSCRKYYICFDSWLNLHECPEGEHFNPEYNHCDKPENVGCLEATTTTVSSTTEPTTTESPSTIPEIILTDCPKEDFAGPIRIPHPTNCVLYYECVKGGKILKKCLIGLHFNPRLQKCDWPETAGCSPKAFECPQDRIILIPHETNSTLYYECNNGEKELKSCREGLKFDPIFAVCDFPEQEHSHKTVRSAAILNGDVLDELVKSRDQEFYYSRNEGTEEDTDRCIGECPLADPVDVLHLAHEECTKFCKCSLGKPYMFVCPHHLHFNLKRQICDHPYNAGCEPQQGRLWA